MSECWRTPITLFFMLMITLIFSSLSTAKVIKMESSNIPNHTTTVLSIDSASAPRTVMSFFSNDLDVSISGVRASALPVTTSLRFSNCNHTLSIMFGLVPLNETNTILKFTNPQFPSNFACSDVVLAQFYEIPVRYQQTFFAQQNEVNLSPKGNQYNLCETIGSYEKQLQKERGIMNCSQLLCDSKINNVEDIVNSLTDGKSTLADWINYCRYCESEGIPDLCLKSPNSGDDQARAMLTAFPTSTQYCGMDIFGVPFLVDTVRIIPQTPFLTNFSSFSFICYCPSINTFAFSCSTSLLKDDIIQQYFLIALFPLTFVALLFGFFIPKIWKIMKTRSGSLITSSCIMLSSTLSIISSLIVVVVPPPLSILISKHVQYFALVTILYSVCSWLLDLYRLISLAKNRQSPKSFYVVHAFLMALFLAVGVVSSVVIATQNEESQPYLLIAEVCLGFIVALFFVIGAMWAYIVMKKISDVNLMRTGFVRFVFYATFVLMIFSISYLLAIIYMRTNTGFALICDSIGKIAIFALFMGVVYADFDRYELREFYGVCLKVIYKCLKKHIKTLKERREGGDSHTESDSSKLLKTEGDSAYQEDSSTSWVTMNSSSVNTEVTTSHIASK
ncbi:hypothetical protein C9374_008246 [Naegleria lovaniensis]|uniref:Uncharacterized protein n=1 Tax=Naegleria lovaniensis TaxID=51637 RepID=A0AA88GFQ1_NAELO|nr:uncharacterized protein C9374_008246 [Naegleria lovaniensis]KAG2378607.1 hypothetical protein C9374_008246 [Naegleria lovaniensis]